MNESPHHLRLELASSNNFNSEMSSVGKTYAHNGQGLLTSTCWKTFNIIFHSHCEEVITHGYYRAHYAITSERKGK